MSRSAQWLLGVGIIFLTSAVGIAFVPLPAEVGRPDITPLWVIGIVALVTAGLIDNRLVRNLMNRVPALRSAASDLARVLEDGQELRASWDALPSKNDPAQIEEWRDRFHAWGKDARRTVKRHVGHREPWFERGLATTVDAGFRNYIDPRIARLEELLKEQR